MLTESAVYWSGKSRMEFFVGTAQLLLQLPQVSAFTFAGPLQGTRKTRRKAGFYYSRTQLRRDSVQVPILGEQDVLDAFVDHLLEDPQAIEILRIVVILNMDHHDVLHPRLIVNPL